MHSGVEEFGCPRQSHKLEIAGSNPATATTEKLKYFRNFFQENLTFFVKGWYNIIIFKIEQWLENNAIMV